MRKILLYALSFISMVAGAVILHASGEPYVYWGVFALFVSYVAWDETTWIEIDEIQKMDEIK